MRSAIADHHTRGAVTSSRLSEGRVILHGDRTVVLL